MLMRIDPTHTKNCTPNTAAKKARDSASMPRDDGTDRTESPETTASGSRRTSMADIPADTNADAQINTSAPTTTDAGMTNAMTTAKRPRR